MKSKSRVVLLIILMLCLSFIAVSCDKLGGSDVIESEFYSVTFIVDGETYTTIDVQNGAYVAIPANPFKEGYNFSGWFLETDFVTPFNANSVLQKKDTTPFNVYGKFTENRIDVTYLSNLTGEVITGIDTTFVKDVSELDSIEAPEVFGYVFNGWILPSIYGDTIVVTANYEKINISIKLYDGISMIDEYTCDYSSTNYEPEDPAQKPGYVFSNWCLDYECTIPASFTSPITSSKVYYAKYNSIPYTIKFNNTEFANATVTVADNRYYLPTIPSSSSEKFLGWYTSSTFEDSTKLNTRINIADYVSLATGTNRVINLYARVLKNQVLVNYYYDNNIFIEQVGYATGVSNNLKMLENNFKTGYIFNYWCTDKNATEKYGSTGLNINSSESMTLNLYANFSLANYSILYTNIDGLVNPNTAISYNIESDTIELQDASGKTGYTFTGWYSNGTKIESIVKGSYGNLTLDARWQINSHSIVFMNEGSEYSSTIKDYNSSITKPSVDPTKTGYTFVGWTQDLSQTEVTLFDFGTDKMPDNNLTLYAYFEKTEYTVTYYVDGEPYGESDTYKYGETIIPREKPSMENATFTGWFNNSACSGLEDSFSATMGDANLNLYGKFNRELRTISYTFDKGDGSSITGEVSIGYGLNFEDTNLPTIPEKSGYSVVWYYNSAKLELPMQIFDNIEITGEYVINQHNVTYLVKGATYGDDYVTYGEVDTYLFGDSVTALRAVPAAITGYDFSGWTGELPDTMGDHDIEITGEYVPHKHSITYYKTVEGVDGEEFIYTQENVPFGVNLKSILINKPQNITGYTNPGWDVADDATMSDEDITIYCNFVKSTYTITYYVDSVEYDVVSYKYLDTVEGMLAEPDSREGYTFSGWDKEITSIAAQNYKVYGTFNPIQYTITYYLDDTTTYGVSAWQTQDVYYNETIVSLEAPIDPDGKNRPFGGWVSIPTTMPAHDIEIHGTYSNSRTITVNDDGTINSIKCDIGEVIDSTNAVFTPAGKEHYEFKFWTEDLTSNPVVEYTFGVMPNGNLNLYAYYEINTYDVTLSLGTVNGNTVTNVVSTSGATDEITLDYAETDQVKTINYGSTLSDPGAPAVKDAELRDTSAYGLIFVRWYMNDPEIPFDFETPITDNITLHALFRYPVTTLNAQSGVARQGETLAETIEVRGGSVVYEPNKPIIENKDFVGWFKVQEETVQCANNIKYTTSLVTFARGYEVFEDTTLYAGYFDYATQDSTDENVYSFNYSVYNVGTNVSTLNDANYYGPYVTSAFGNVIGTRFVETIPYGEYLKSVDLETSNYVLLTSEQGLVASNSDSASSNTTLIQNALNNDTYDVVIVSGGYYYVQQIAAVSNKKLVIAENSALVLEGWTTNVTNNTMIYVGSGITNFKLEGPGKLMGMGSRYTSGSLSPNTLKANMPTDFNISTVEGMRQSVSTTTSKAYSLVSINGASKVEISNIELVESSSNTINIVKASSINIHNVIINNNVSMKDVTGIYVDGSSQVYIHDNFVVAGNNGIQVESSSATTKEVEIARNKIMSMNNMLQIGFEASNNLSYIYAHDNDMFSANVYPSAITAISIAISQNVKYDSITVHNTRADGVYSGLYVARNRQNTLTALSQPLSNISIDGLYVNNASMSMLAIGNSTLTTNYRISNLAVDKVNYKYYDYATFSGTSTSAANTNASGTPGLLSATNNGRISNSLGLVVSTVTGCYFGSVTVTAPSNNSASTANSISSSTSSATSCTWAYTDTSSWISSCTF